MSVAMLFICSGCPSSEFVDAKQVNRALFCRCGKPLVAAPKSIVESALRRQGVVAS